jgi:VTC domain
VSTAADLLAGVERFEPISLEELDERAALQRRVDNKYVVPADRVADALDTLRDDHRALDIDGRRSFAYESTYFDTPGLTCFRAHVDGRSPRFKVRTRLYADSGACSFEVKLKLADGETAKEQRDHDADERDRLTTDARAFLDRALREHLGRPAPAGLDSALVTRFRRSTLGHADGGERVTIDVELDLVRPGGERARLKEPCAIVETKTPDGDGRCDALLRDAGYEPVSLSKYRTGIALLAADDPEPPSPDPRRLFVTGR